MKVVKLKGGLGNQLFQYSFALLLSTLTSEEVRLDYSAYEDNSGDTVRVPRLTQFNISVNACTKEEIRKITIFPHNMKYGTLIYKVFVYLESKFNSKYFLSPREYIDPNQIIKYSYFDGYWQNIDYLLPIQNRLFEDLIPKNELSDATNATISMIDKQNSVFIGVRRGDYTLEKGHYGEFRSDYYLRAMEYISHRIKNPVFYIFSNDIEWCKMNLEWGEYQVNYREPNQQTSDFEELMIMASCKHAIIINSTYHWWGAFLIRNQNKIVCCPEKWFFDNAKINIYPSDWIKMPV